MGRKNDDNLIPLTKRTKAEQREIQKMGGMASGVSRNKKKKMFDRLSLILLMKPNMEAVPDNIKMAMSMMGFEANAVETNDDLLAVSLFVRALEDTNTQKYLDEIMGRNPQLKLKQAEAKLNRMRLDLEKQKMVGRIEFDDVIQTQDVKPEEEPQQ